MPTLARSARLSTLLGAALAAALVVAVPAARAGAAAPSSGSSSSGSSSSGSSSSGSVSTAGEVKPLLTIDYANEKAAFLYLVGKGLTKKQAAGVIGNLDVESGMDPTIKQIGGGTGRGIAQWGTGGRWNTFANDNQLWWTQAHGAAGSSSYSLTNQLGFLWYELTSLSYYGGPALKKTTTVKDATQVFMDQFERPASSSSFDTRYDYGVAAYERYKDLDI